MICLRAYGSRKIPAAPAGYQYLVGVFFLIVFPLNILLRSFAATLTVLYSWKNAGAALITICVT